MSDGRELVIPPQLAFGDTHPADLIFRSTFNTQYNAPTYQRGLVKPDTIVIYRVQLTDIVGHRSKVTGGKNVDNW